MKTLKCKCGASITVKKEDLNVDTWTEEGYYEGGNKWTCENCLVPSRK